MLVGMPVPLVDGLRGSEQRKVESNERYQRYLFVQNPFFPEAVQNGWEVANGTTVHLAQFLNAVQNHWILEMLGHSSRLEFLPFCCFAVVVKRRM